MDSISDSRIDLDFEQFGWSSTNDMYNINELKLKELNPSKNKLVLLNDINDIICFTLFLFVFIYCLFEEVFEIFAEEINLIRKFLIASFNYFMTIKISF